MKKDVIHIHQPFLAADMILQATLVMYIAHPATFTWHFLEGLKFKIGMASSTPKKCLKTTFFLSDLKNQAIVLPVTKWSLFF